MSAREIIGTSLSSTLAEGTKSRPTSIASGSHQVEGQESAADGADNAEAKSEVKNDTIFKGMEYDREEPTSESILASLH